MWNERESKSKTEGTKAKTQTSRWHYCVDMNTFTELGIIKEVLGSFQITMVILRDP